MWLEKLGAWVPDALPSDEASRHALGMTSPGMGLDVWTDVRWQVSGHFDDPSSSACGIVTDTAGNSYFAQTPEAATAWCRNQFVLDELGWLPVSPTGTPSGASPIASPSP